MQNGYELDMRRLNLRSTAFHEAGHAISAVLNGIAFSRVWILRREDSDPVPQNVELGQLTRTTPINKLAFKGKLNEAQIEAVQAFSGPIAECLAYPGMVPDWHLNQGDFLDARSFIRFAIIPFNVAGENATFGESDLKRAEPEVNRLLNKCLQNAARMINSHLEQIQHVANMLLARWELTQEDVIKIAQADGV